MDSSDEDYCPSPDPKFLDISNDVFYLPPPGSSNKTQKSHIPQSSTTNVRGETVVHSLPAYDLWKPIFPTHLAEKKLLDIHRPKLRHYNTGRQSFGTRRRKRFPVKNLTKTIYRHCIRSQWRIMSAIQRNFTRDEISKKLLIRSSSGLSAKKGELFMFEYCEQYPAVLSQVGMASIIKTYIYPGIHTNSSKSSTTNSDSSTVRKAFKQDNSQHDRDIGGLGYQEICNHGKPVYFNLPKPGSRFQVIENNLYRAPIYKHQFPATDFLIIRTRNSFYVREVTQCFVVGQTMHLSCVPAPTDKVITRFRSDFSNRYIHMLLKGSRSCPPTFDLETLSKYFPYYTIGSLKARLKYHGAEIFDGTFVRQGSSKFGALSLQEVRQLLTPERYCLHMAMFSARQRLRELNYTESMINSTSKVNLETEVLAAPWNTSKALAEAQSGKTYLDFKSHEIDPTGPANEGFSCVAWTKSTIEANQAIEQRSVLRSNNLGNVVVNPLAKEIRAEKMARMNIFRNEAAMIAQIQANALSSGEILSSDDESEGEEEKEETELDKSFEQQLQDLSKLVVENKTASQLDNEKEEEERLQLMAELCGGDGRRTNGDDDQPSSQIKTDFSNKLLKITRDYESDNGMRISRTEMVREPKIIALYLKYKEEMSETCATSEGALQGDNGPAKPSGTVRHTRRTPVPEAEELCRVEGTRLTIKKSVLQM